MNYSDPTLLVVSGPNGAGKSTHIQAMLPNALEGIQSFDRDYTRSQFEAELRLSGVPSGLITRKATELMEARLMESMRSAIGLRQHFVLETPLSHPDYWNYLDLFEQNGYQIQMNYLSLDRISDCIARVGQRVMEGGHYVAPDTIGGVYRKNLEFINAYYQTFKCIELYDGMRIPILLARLEHNRVVFAERAVLNKGWVRDGLPSIDRKIREYLDNKLAE